MTYVTKQSLVDQFGSDDLAQLTDRFGDGDLDDDVLNRAIASAERTVNSYIAPRYTLPLEQALIDGSNLAEVTGDIVRYRLMNDLATDEVRQRYEDALRWLRDVQMNKASLGEQDTGVAPTTGRVVTRVGASNTDWDSY